MATEAGCVAPVSQSMDLQVSAGTMPGNLRLTKPGFARRIVLLDIE